MSYTNQVAVITGASSGIGWELAKELARRHCAVGLVARRRERLEALAGEIRALGGKTAFAPADVTDRQQTVDALRRVRDELGPVDLLVANSGVSAPTKINPLNIDEIDQMFRVNVLGVIYAIEGVLPEMLQRGRGHIAAMSSLASYRGLPGESGYCASKAAVNIYLDGLRLQLRSRGVAVTTVCPGFVHTPMTAPNNFKMPWVMPAERAAKLIVRALERKKKVFNFPWQTAWLMKGAAWLPDWLLARIMNRYVDDRQQQQHQL
jgi:short-subunit dehydrogenase